MSTHDGAGRLTGHGTGAVRYLRGTGVHARIEPDTLVPGAFVLSIGGAEQSHVDAADPSHVFYAYLRRMANVVDVTAPAGAPVRALHLGAGALTLARYIEATRPGSRQTAVELERELLDFVLEQLPLAEGTDLMVHLGDARWALPDTSGRGPFDVIVLDIFSGPGAPEHIAQADFYREAAALLAPGGVMLVNIGDDPPLTLVRSQLAAMDSVFADVAALAEPEMFTRRYPGNIVVIGLSGPWPDEWTAALPAAGPHPTKLARGVDLDGLRD